MEPPIITDLSEEELQQALIDTSAGIALAGMIDGPHDWRVVTAHNTKRSYAFLRKGAELCGWCATGCTKQQRQRAFQSAFDKLKKRLRNGELNAQ